MIEKDLQPIYNAMVKTTYGPVILRTVVILLIHDMDRMQAGLKINDREFRNMLALSCTKQALHTCLDKIYEKREGIIEQLLIQYGINTSNEMNGFYHASFQSHVLRAVNIVKTLVKQGRYAKLDEIGRTQV